MRRTAVEGQALDTAMGREQDCAAGRLVNPARFHADKPALYQVQPADPVPTSERGQACEQPRGRERLAVDRDRITALKGDLDIFRSIGRGFGGDGAAEDEFLGL